MPLTARPDRRGEPLNRRARRSTSPGRTRPGSLRLAGDDASTRDRRRRMPCADLPGTCSPRLIASGSTCPTRDGPGASRRRRRWGFTRSSPRTCWRATSARRSRRPTGVVHIVLFALDYDDQVIAPRDRLRPGPGLPAERPWRALGPAARRIHLGGGTGRRQGAARTTCCGRLPTTSSTATSRSPTRSATRSTRSRTRS